MKISTFKEYQETRNEQNRLKNHYWLLAIPTFICMISWVIASASLNGLVNIPTVYTVIGLLSMIPGIFLFLSFVRLYKKIEDADLSCRNFLNAHQAKKVTWLTAGKGLKKIENNVRIKFAE